MKKDVGPMITQVLEKMIQNSKRHVLLMCELIEGGKELTIVVKVATAVHEESRGGFEPCSVRWITQTLERPVSTVHKILRNILHCYPYKINHAQELLPSDLPAR
ncbi:uncharacterized protein TNCV_3817411 [Trichonephila clavipes]|nr:uncharacterized protein TNCV_3817411 [Trichonephila clavipes]